MTDEDRLIAGRYRLGTRLGAGAMGVVWQAHDERLHRTVAVKQLLLSPGLSAEQSEEARLRAMREGRIAARLAHPNAITVYDAVEHDGDPWLVMEYLPSQSLAAVIQERGPLPPVEAARIGAQVATALIAAHAAGIVHRDVKPANVLLGNDGTVKITDFGISRATGDVTVTATGMLAGTPAYLAPEVAKGQKPTPASDVFSLGSTLYTSVEGHSPFGQGDNTLALLYAVAAGKIEPPKQAGPLTALLMRLLRAEPAERPTMTAARDALAAVAAGRALPMLDPHDATAPVAGPTIAAAASRGAPMTRLDARPFSDAPLGPPSGPLRRPPGPPGLAAPPPPPGRPQQPTGGQPAAGQRRGRTAVVTVLAVVAAALVGILVASLVNANQRNGQSGSGQTSSGQTASEQKSPSSAKSPTSTVKGGTTPAGQLSDTDYEKAIRDYYALLPAHIDQAWSLLTPQAQQKANGEETFKNFWSGIKSVEVRAARAEGNKVAARLHFVKDNGAQSTENYAFVLVQRDGKLLIDFFQMVGRS